MGFSFVFAEMSLSLKPFIRQKSFKRQFHKMAKHTQTFRRFVGLALKGLRINIYTEGMKRYLQYFL